MQRVIPPCDYHLALLTTMHFSLSRALASTFLLASTFAQQNPIPSKSDAIAVISPNHIGITVHSIADALPFWRDTLGLPLVWVYNSTDKPISTLVGVPGANVSFYFLQLPGGNMIELVEYTALRSVRKAYYPESSDVGSVHISLDVKGLDEIVRRAKGIGWKIVGGGPVILPDTRKAVYLRSIADGTTVELFEGKMNVAGILPPGIMP
jgi:catechol 2,3-dioxygenase-like lactoylglutathione lyase family enzyme